MVDIKKDETTGGQTTTHGAGGTSQGAGSFGQSGTGSGSSAQSGSSLGQSGSGSTSSSTSSTGMGQGGSEGLRSGGTYAQERAREYYDEASRRARERSREWGGRSQGGGRQARQYADEAARRAEDYYEEGGEWARDSYSRAADWAQDQYAHAYDYGRQGWDATQRFVRDNPVLLGVVGFASGLLLGALLPRTRHENRYLGEWADDIRGQGARYARDAVQRGREYAEQAFSGDERNPTHESEWRHGMSEETQAARRTSPLGQAENKH